MSAADAVRERVKNAVNSLVKEEISAGRALEVTFAETASGITVTVMGSGDEKRPAQKRRGDSDGNSQE